jgi:long-chain acyl-CoA synthetase
LRGSKEPVATSYHKIYFSEGRGIVEKIWIKNYPAGVPAEIDVGNDTLVDLVNKICIKYADNKAVSCHGASLSFASVGERVDSLATSLYEMGVKKGDRVAVIMPNIMQYPIAIFAILKIGAVVVNINPLYTEHEMAYILEDSGAKAAIVLNMMARKLNNLINKGSLEHIIVARVPDLYPFLKRSIINFVIKTIKHTDISYKAHNFRDCALNNKKLRYDPKLVNTDLAFIQYTGATTGKPKGAMLSHRNIVANIKQVHAWLSPQVGSLSNHIAIDALPLYHIFSLTANLFTFFFAGSENVMVPNPRDVKDMVSILNKSKFTVFSALDTLYNHLLLSEEFRQNKYPYFKYSVAGGMPARSSVAHDWYKQTGVMPSNCYGMTEASPAVTMNPLDNTFDGSVGFPIPSTEVIIRSIDGGSILPVNETGIIWVHGPQVMRSYWNKPEQTAKAIDKDGWFNTEDLGYLNEQGKLFISGRQNDMIIVSGFNVYPVEIENALDSISDIKESAVIGVKDTDTGERSVAFVIFKSGAYMTENEIILELRKQLTSYKVPREIIIIKDDLPKTLIGKIDKVALSKKYLEKDQ